MIKTGMKMNAQIEGARLTIEGAKNHPEIKKRLGRYGYNDKRFDEGLDMIESIGHYTAQQDENQGLQKEATARYQHERELLQDLYLKHLALARVALKEDITAGDVLRLWGARQRDIAGWIAQVSTFYTQAGRYATLLAPYNISEEAMAQGKAMVQAIKETRVQQARGRSEAQLATKRRRKSLAELMLWVSELRYITRMAFKDEPQYLEALGEVTR
ncbi:MAG: hypothetical protein RIG62_11290 [Cyclobacteriaceae bacterium]